MSSSCRCRSIDCRIATRLPCSRRAASSKNGRLTTYGKSVEAMPVDRAWAELLVNADDEMVPYLAVSSAIESLHRMTREERNLEGLIVPGSDHLTAYNVYAEALSRCGYVGEVYGLSRHQFTEDIADWAEERGRAREVCGRCGARDGQYLPQSRDGHPHQVAVCA